MDMAINIVEPTCELVNSQHQTAGILPKKEAAQLDQNNYVLPTGRYSIWYLFNQLVIFTNSQ